ncbi:MAG: cupin domain-containing protein [Porticoccaceae bacterium]|jgi:50S ribosomal protein L16 3-hydroxylase|nr:cupin domain-containing protein [Porticoccaceae bacterium]MDA8735132.1 cupin domain-containing protein [Porticoccaceae bacterium]MDA9839842.1 cupin domain-containing protein [Porticoccaceae bacterium]MDG1705304.1 cupin domain-containing protein [Porticoccaceae bacterium]
MNKQTALLGDISPQEFLRDYWQKKPLLIRSAIADFEPPIDGDELAGLALEPEVESRLVIGQDWQLENGPFAEQRFQTLPPSHWTLLVQAVDLWVPEVAALLERFTFLPPWRLDDIMVSYAEDGGSVGPHFDYYDVFLLQGSGQRRWQIGQVCDSNRPLLADTDLKILSEFNATEEWVLNCGDMLYIPPKIAHHGVAIGECTTFSVGFRAPSATDMLDDLATELLSRGLAPNYLTDPPLTPEMATDKIPEAYIAKIRSLMLELLDDDQLLAQWFAQYMTEPKYPMLTDITGEQRRASINCADTSGGRRYFNNGLEQD